MFVSKKSIAVVLTLSMLLTGCISGNNEKSITNSQSISTVDTFESQDEMKKKISDSFWGLDEEEDREAVKQAKKEKKKKNSKINKKIYVDLEQEAIDNRIDIDDDDFDINLEDSSDDERTVNNSGKRVICWGDSMTIGLGGNGVSYPSTLEKISGAEVLNYGVCDETTRDIAAREGARPQYTTGGGDIIIPADCTPIELNTSSIDGEWPKLTIFGIEGVNPCMVGNVEGTYYHDDQTGLKMFKRNQPGEAVVISDRTKVQTFASTDHRPDDIVILWTGNNEMPETAEAIRDTIFWQKEILKHSGAQNYAVISLTTACMLKQIDLINEMFKREYGDHYIDLRSYVLGDMMTDAGITPTQEDLMYVSIGLVPPSLMDTDKIHGNATFYEYAGKYIYKNLQKMGYLE